MGIRRTRDQDDDVVVNDVLLVCSVLIVSGVGRGEFLVVGDPPLCISKSRRGSAQN